MSEQLDTIIVGGGFSGIAAARLLHKAGKKFMLLEARERLGGRTHTRYFTDGKYVDLGGQWIGPTQDHMYSLAKEHNVAWYETYNEGKNILDLNKTIKTYTGLIPKMDVASLINIDLLLKRLESLAKQIPLEAPWLAPKAKEWDSISLETFVRKYSYTAPCYKVVRAGLETVYACEMNEVSLLHALFYIKSGTNLNNLLSIKDGAQQHRLAGGMQTLAERIAESFSASIRLNSPVMRITQTDEGVAVEGSDYAYPARNIIVAIPPVLISNIEFTPALPLHKTQLIDKMSMALWAKCWACMRNLFGEIRDIAARWWLMSMGRFKHCSTPHLPIVSMVYYLPSALPIGHATSFQKIRTQERILRCKVLQDTLGRQQPNPLSM